jgi:uncharacterized protein (TIGR02594 family)
MPSVARQDVDVAGNKKLVEGAQSVLVNDHPMVLIGSANAAGATVVRGSTTVDAENRQIARVGDAMSNGTNITTGSLNVFAYGDDYSHEAVKRTLTIPEVKGLVASAVSAKVDQLAAIVGLSNKGDVPVAAAVGLPAPSATTALIDCPTDNLSQTDKFLKLGRTLDQLLYEAANGRWKENGSNNKIINCYKSVGFNINGDSTPWCAAFAGWILKMCCLPSKKTLSSLEYRGYGTAVPLGDPSKWRLNDIVIFTRKGGGHIGFFRGYNPTTGAIKILGGNQGDNLTETNFSAPWPSQVVYVGRSWQLPPEYNVAVTTAPSGLDKSGRLTAFTDPRSSLYVPPTGGASSIKVT